MKDKETIVWINSQLSHEIDLTFNELKRFTNPGLFKRICLGFESGVVDKNLKLFYCLFSIISKSEEEAKEKGYLLNQLKLDLEPTIKQWRDIDFAHNKHKTIKIRSFMETKLTNLTVNKKYLGCAHSLLLCTGSNIMKFKFDLYKIGDNLNTQIKKEEILIVRVGLSFPLMKKTDLIGIKTKYEALEYQSNLLFKGQDKILKLKEIKN